MIKFNMKAGRLKMKPIDVIFKDRFAHEVAEPEMLNQAKICKERAEANERANGGTIKTSYSESYIKAIIAGTAKGASGVRKATTDVNLTVTGEFLSSMQVKRSGSGARVFFSGTHATSGRNTLLNASLAGYLFDMGYSGWFDFSDADKDRMMRAFSRFVDRHTKDLVTIV